MQILAIFFLTCFVVFIWRPIGEPGILRRYFGSIGTLLYLVMYVSSLAVCLIPTYMKNKENYYYRSLGASGASFGSDFCRDFCRSTIALWTYVYTKFYNSRDLFLGRYILLFRLTRKTWRWPYNHSAHLWGALYGIVFLIVMSFALHTGFNPFTNFVSSVQDYFMNR